MVIDDRKRQFYEQTLETAKEEIESLNKAIDRELAQVTALVNDLKEEREAIRQVCRGACRMLGTECELDEPEEFEGDEPEDKE